MSEMPNSDLTLLVNVCKERSAVVDAEVEDSVLVGGLEGGAENSGVGGFGDGGEVKAVEGREHAELKLDMVALGGDVRDELVLAVLGNLHGKSLVMMSVAVAEI